METIKISKTKQNYFTWLVKEYDTIYGDEDTMWTLDDLDELRKIGEEFVNFFRKHTK